MGNYVSRRETAVHNDAVTTQQEQGKCHDPDDKTLKFVSRKDDITGDDDPDTQTVEMSCGHAATPESLTGWCRSLLDQGQYKFTCPAVKDGTTEKCGKEWPYQEVQRLLVLTDSEQKHFEESMAPLAAAEFCEYKSCPGCKSFVERKTLTNLRVHCKVCTAERGRTYEFCWQCLRQWKGPAPRSDCCDNDDCTNKDRDLLQNCAMTTLPSVKNVQCPSIRACPNCGRLIEHSRSGCKYITCSRCQEKFCFLCLKLYDCHLSPNWHEICPDGVSPRQTSVPSRNRK